MFVQSVNHSLFIVIYLIIGLTSTTTTRNFFPSRASPEEELVIMLGVMFPNITARLVKFHIPFYGTINQM